MNSSDSFGELATALALAQGEVENVVRDNINPHFKSKYADLAAIWDVIRGPLTKNGISVVQLPVTSGAMPGAVGLSTTILHKSGESLSETFFCQLKDPSNPQAVGSALTYMKRYALLGVAGIAPEDDDGNAATAPPRTATVDPSTLVEETLAQLAKASDAEARTIYATVRASSISQPTKDELLMRMAAVIQQRRTAAKEAAKK